MISETKIKFSKTLDIAYLYGSLKKFERDENMNKEK